MGEGYVVSKKASIWSVEREIAIDILIYFINIFYCVTQEQKNQIGVGDKETTIYLVRHYNTYS